MSFDGPFGLSAEEFEAREQARAETEAEFALSWEITTILRNESKKLEQQKRLVVDAASVMLMNEVMADPYSLTPAPGKVRSITEARSYVEPAEAANTKRRRAQ